MKSILTRARKNSGFTILEMLVTLFLLSLIVTSIAGGLHFGRRAWELGRVNEEQGDLDAASRVFTNLIAKALPSVALDESQKPALVFVGTSQSLLFVTLSEGETQFAGPVLTRIDAVKTGAGARELRLWTSVFRTQAAWTTTRARMRHVGLVKGLVSFDLSYFGVAKPGRSPRWRSDWVGRDQLPLLVAIKLVVIRGSRRHVVALTVRLRQS